jgi:hypothetical protein
MSSLAVKIPPELFPYILWHINKDDQNPFTPVGKNTSHDIKHRISTCGQVCRYWARVCRPHIFSYITLRSPEDLQFFKAALCKRPLAGLPPITTYVKSVTAVLDAEHAPWLQLLPSLMPHLVHSDVTSVSLTMDGTSLQAQGIIPTYTALYPPPPRSHPSLYTPISRLYIAHVHFHSGFELASLLSSLPSLAYTSLEYLTWDIQPDCNTFLNLRMRNHKTAFEVKGTGEFFTYFIPALAIETAATVPDRTVRRLYPCALNSQDYDAVIDIFAAFMAATPDTLKWYLSSRILHPGKRACLLLRNRCCSSASLP